MTQLLDNVILSLYDVQSVSSFQCYLHCIVDKTKIFPDLKTNRLTVIWDHLDNSYI